MKTLIRFRGVRVNQYFLEAFIYNGTEAYYCEEVEANGAKTEHLSD